MIVNYKTINNPKVIRNDSQIIKLSKTNKNKYYFFKVQNSTPKLPSIKKIFPEGNKTLLIKMKKEKNNSNSHLFFSTPKNIVKNHSYRNIRIKKLNSIIPINFSSSETIKIPNIRIFHNKIMSENRLSCAKTIYKENLKFDEQNQGNYISSILSGSDNSKIKTGIYGPNNNIVSVIRARMERLKYDNEYKGIDSEIKELIKDEIMDAQVKLKRKPEDLFKKKNEIKSLCSKKIDQYKYLTRMNSLREINQMTTTPIIVRDGQVMLKLINDAFDYFKLNK